jgi:ABC-type nitrate/sulfonate/bicarbonate transport system permease component
MGSFKSINHLNLCAKVELPKLKRWIDKNEAQLIQFYQNKPQNATIPIFFLALIISIISIVIGVFLLFIGLSS